MMFFISVFYINKNQHFGLDPSETAVFRFIPKLREYKTGSIYSALKDVNPEWTFEKLATGVNAILIENSFDDIEIGYGADPIAAQSARLTVKAGTRQIVPVAGQWIAWRGNEGIAMIEQSKLV